MVRIPLSPPQGGECILDSALQPADIIVATTRDPRSVAIRDWTGSPISHCMLYAGGGLVIEAINEGVVSRPLSTALCRHRGRRLPLQEP